MICRCPLHCCAPRCRTLAAFDTVKCVCVAAARQTGTCVNKQPFERVLYIIQHTQSLRSRLSMGLKQDRLFLLSFMYRVHWNAFCIPD